MRGEGTGTRARPPRTATRSRSSPRNRCPARRRPAKHTWLRAARAAGSRKTSSRSNRIPECSARQYQQRVRVLGRALQGGDPSWRRVTRFRVRKLRHEDPESATPKAGRWCSGEPVGYQNLLVRDNATGTYRLVNVPPPGVTPADAHFQGCLVRSQPRGLQRDRAVDRRRAVRRRKPVRMGRRRPAPGDGAAGRHAGRRVARGRHAAYAPNTKA